MVVVELIADADANGDISGDDQSIASDHHLDHNDENSMDSDRDGALNLVRLIKFLIFLDNIQSNRIMNKLNVFSLNICL